MSKVRNPYASTLLILGVLFLLTGMIISGVASSSVDDFTDSLLGGNGINETAVGWASFGGSLVNGGFLLFLGWLVVEGVAHGLRSYASRPQSHDDASL